MNFFAGLAKLILGSCHGCLKNHDEAIIAYRECIEQRGELLDDLHISAFAYFELAMLLMRHRNDVRFIYFSKILS